MNRDRPLRDFLCLEMKPVWFIGSVRFLWRAGRLFIVEVCVTCIISCLVMDSYCKKFVEDIFLKHDNDRSNVLERKELKTGFEMSSRVTSTSTRRWSRLSLTTSSRRWIPTMTVRSTAGSSTNTASRTSAPKSDHKPYTQSIKPVFKVIQYYSQLTTY